jgi:hypothetical protein
MFALLSMLLVTATSVAAEGELGSTVVEAIRNHVAAKKGIPAEDVEVGAVGIDVVSDCEQTPSFGWTPSPANRFGAQLDSELNCRELVSCAVGLACHLESTCTGWFPPLRAHMKRAMWWKWWNAGSRCLRFGLRLWTFKRVHLLPLGQLPKMSR